MATGAISAVSIVDPTTAPTCAVLRTRPYSPNVPARHSAIHGGVPARHVRIVTPTAAHPIASHASRDSRSRNTSMPSATDTSGLMK